MGMRIRFLVVDSIQNDKPVGWTYGLNAFDSKSVKSVKMAGKYDEKKHGVLPRYPVK